MHNYNRFSGLQSGGSIRRGTQHNEQLDQPSRSIDYKKIGNYALKATQTASSIVGVASSIYTIYNVYHEGWEAGMRGRQGPAGPQGLQGIQGLVGVRGPRGLQGHPGELPQNLPVGGPAGFEPLRLPPPPPLQSVV